jgi:AAA+ ATPase superfamily predicted ATPase
MGKSGKIYAGGKSVNPFIYSKPVYDFKNFKGRTEEIKEISSRLNTFQNVSIIGQRRIGRTSLLLNIESIAKNWEYLFPKMIFIYFDFQGRISITPTEFYKLLTEETIVKSNKKDHPITTKVIVDREGVKFDEFIDFIEYITEGEIGIVYLFDEFESCIRNNNSAELLSGLRAIGSKPKVALVTSTQKELFELISQDHPTSPFFNLFSKVALGLLKEEEAKSIIIDYPKESRISLEEEA